MGDVSPAGGAVTTPDAVVETHLSTLVFVGDRAYKRKKPVRFGFVDFSTAARSTTMMLGGQGRYVLVWLREVGRSEVCPANAPYQGRLSGLGFDAVG